MLATLTVYRNRLRVWLQEVVPDNRYTSTTPDTTKETATNTATTTATATTVTADTTERKGAGTIMASGTAPPALTPSRAGSEERPSPPLPRPQDSQPGMSSSNAPYPDEEYMAEATVLSSMPEDMPLPPLAYTRRRSSSKTHTRLYRIRLPPKPRRAKR